jgi:hypothetical protein
MALIETFSPSIAGTAPDYDPAASGDTAEVGPGLWLIVKNGGSSMTATLATPGNVVTGDAIPDKVYTVPGSGEAWIPLLEAYRDATDQYAHITWSTLTSVTRAVVRVR